jgi:hypothetical protein
MIGQINRLDGWFIADLYTLQEAQDEEGDM